MNYQDSNEQLRQKLQALRRKTTVDKSRANAKPRSDEELKRLVHDLQVHQIELEMQNRHLRETQVELEHSRNLFAELYDSAPVGYIDFDHSGTVRQINLTGAELLGCVRERIVGKPFSIFLAGPDALSFSSHLRSCWKTRRKGVVELELKVKDGTTLPVQLSSVAMEAADKSQGVCRTILTDISERKRAETEKAELVQREQVARAEAERERELDIINQKQAAEALRESEARLRIAIEAAHIGTWDWQIREDRIDWGGEQD